MERKIKKQSIGFKKRWGEESQCAGCSVKPLLGDEC